MAITLTCDLTSAQDDEDILMALTKAIQQHLMKHHQFPGIFPDAEPLSEQASFNHALDLLLILPYEIEIQLIGGPKDSKIIDKLNQWLARPEEKAGTPASQRVKFPIKITRRDDNTHSEPAAAAAAEAALAPWQTQLIPALVANVRTLFQESNPPGNNNASAHHLVNQALPIIMSADFLTKNLQDIINAAEIPAGNLSKENQNFLDHCRVIYFLSMMSILLSSGKQDLFLELLNEVDKIITTHPQDPIWESMACHAQIARGHTLTVKGQFYAALEGYTKLLNTLVQLYGPQYCRVIAIEKSILETTLACGKIDEKQRKDFAEQYQQNIAKTEQWYGDDHLEVVTAWGAKAKFLASGKDREDARDLFLKEKYWYEAKNKCKTAGYAGTINNLASIYADLKEFKEALPLYQSAVEIYTQLYGEDSQFVANILNNLATLYVDQKKFDEAKPLYKKVLAILEAHLGKSHPKLAATLNNLASLYNRKGRYDKAETLFKQSLEITQAALGEDHPNTASTLNNLGALYFTAGNQIIAKLSPDFVPSTVHEGELALNILPEKFNAARRCLVESKKIREEKLGPNHPHTVITQQWVVLLTEQQGILHFHEGCLELFRIRTILGNATSISKFQARVVKDSLELAKEKFADVEESLNKKLTRLSENLHKTSASLAVSIPNPEEKQKLLKTEGELRNSIKKAQAYLKKFSEEKAELEKITQKVSTMPVVSHQDAPVQAASTQNNNNDVDIDGQTEKAETPHLVTAHTLAPPDPGVFSSESRPQYKKYTKSAREENNNANNNANHNNNNDDERSSKRSRLSPSGQA